MDYITTSQIYQLIERTSPSDSKELFYQTAIRYAHLKAEFYLANRETRKEMKDVLIQSENALLEAWNRLGLSVYALVTDTSRSDSDGNDDDKIRNFACYLHFIMSVLSIK